MSDLEETRELPRSDRDALASFLMSLALAAGAWSLMIGGHEILGHGGAQFLLGGELYYIDAMYFDGSKLPGFGTHIQRAGGSIFNVLLGFACAWWLFRREPRAPWLRYFLWVSVLYNLFQSGCYIAFGWAIHPGMDWAILSSLVDPVWAGRALVMAVGGIIIAAALVLTYKGMHRLLRPDLPVRGQKARLLVGAWLTSGLVSIPASLLVPSDDRMMMLLGGIGNSLIFMAWSCVLMLVPGPEPPASAADRLLLRWPVFVVSLTVALLYVFVLGPGIDLR